MLSVTFVILLVCLELLLILTSVSSLKMDATFNIDFILFIIGPTSFTIGIASLTTPNVFDVLLSSDDQLIPLDAPATALVFPKPNSDLSLEPREEVLATAGILFILKPLFIIGAYDILGITNGPPI